MNEYVRRIFFNSNNNIEIRILSFCVNLNVHIVKEYTDSRVLSIRTLQQHGNSPGSCKEILKIGTAYVDGFSHFHATPAALLVS